MTVRSLDIDITKGILTIGMVFAHVIQLLAFQPNVWLSNISGVANLVSFSGFYFCFGYAVWTAYLQKETPPWKSVIRTAIKCYIAFLVSGIAFLTLVSNKPLEIQLVLKVALLRVIPGYSEFLISFALIVILSSIFSSLITKCITGKNILYASLACSVFMFLPKHISFDPYVGLFIGGKGYAYFPVIQYLPLFLFGAFLARYNFGFDKRLFFVSVGLVLVYYILTLYDVQASRFPPSLLWIVGSAGLTYIYYGIAVFIGNNATRFIKFYLNVVGQNVLLYLVVSNIIIFTLVALGLSKSLNVFESVFVFAAIMLGILFLHYISVDFSTTDKRMR
ncbi:MAG: hypothetical protein OEZ68_15235 [Gammaproteobacteria bacterium]|nr:hypothetical protein [Gammaproteobacteria bacterium]MDH5802154.1 hypothetical protein [Gammaproteobacteria bacterium]